MRCMVAGPAQSQSVHFHLSQRQLNQKLISEIDSEQDEKNKPAKPKKRRSEKRNDDALEFIKDYTRRQEDAQKERAQLSKQMHEEKMSLFKQFIDVISKKD